MAAAEHDGVSKSGGGAASEVTPTPTAAAAARGGGGGRGYKAVVAVVALAVVFVLGWIGGGQRAGMLSLTARQAPAASASLPAPSGGGGVGGLRSGPAVLAGSRGAGTTGVAQLAPRLQHHFHPYVLEGMLRDLLAGDGGKEQFRFLYVDLPRRMTYCSINKVASSAWRRVMYLAATPDAPLVEPQSAELEVRMHKWFKGAVEAMTPREKLAALVSGGTVASVVVRDPLERFISGFLNKCVATGTSRAEAHMMHCPVRRRATPAATLDALLAALTAAARRHTTLDSHFLPQHTFCGLRLFASYFRVIKFDDMLAGGEALIAAAPVSANQRTRLYAALRASIAGPKANPTTSLKSEMDALLTRDRVQRIAQLYMEDYRVFGFPLPPLFKADASDPGGL